MDRVFVEAYREIRDGRAPEGKTERQRELDRDARRDFMPLTEAQREHQNYARRDAEILGNFPKRRVVVLSAAEQFRRNLFRAVNDDGYGCGDVNVVNAPDPVPTIIWRVENRTKPKLTRSGIHTRKEADRVARSMREKGHDVRVIQA
ncbi:MAG: hypothetical protein ACTHJR_11010 [Sphingomonas sp.]|uniref:hypothetical protein n=1 Tax=Sphingomonas sp. TaxID=28214 RepID=UPI003F7FAECF